MNKYVMQSWQWDISGNVLGILGKFAANHSSFFCFTFLLLATSVEVTMEVKSRIMTSRWSGCGWRPAGSGNKYIPVGIIELQYVLWTTYPWIFFFYFYEKNKLFTYISYHLLNLWLSIPYLQCHQSEKKKHEDENTSTLQGYKINIRSQHKHGTT